ncbi:MAG: PfkB family carbohydrate kinase [Planctomycetota bacterium]|jgi:sugar/nucleoside kinase (ribokinase family)|nr:PfkB family carbohydrate kinase [Planctomycetota bacterium]
MTLTVVGSIGIDTVETPFGKVEDVPGGSALYFSLAASHFTKVQVAANLGTDFPESAWNPVRSRGGDLNGLRVFEDQGTFRWSGSYMGDMNEAQTLLTELNVLAEPPVVPAAYQGCSFAFLANMGTDVQLRMLEELKADTVFADTMNLWIDTQRENLDELLSKIDGFILNDAEARMLTGETNLIRAGSALLKMGPKIVILKKGEHGAFLFTDNFHFALPSYPTARVVDPTGAGDSFAGGFLGSLAEMGELKPDNLRRAMAYGTVAASMTVEEFSTKALAECNREALDNRFSELCDFVRI